MSVFVCVFLFIVSVLPVLISMSALSCFRAVSHYVCFLCVACLLGLVLVSYVGSRFCLSLLFFKVLFVTVAS